MIRSALTDCLEDKGYEVVALEGAAAVFEQFGRGLLPPVVITDLGLGQGGDGVALADELHRLSPASFVVFITGRFELMGERGLKDRECVLPKPFRFEALVEMLGRIGSGPPPDATLPVG